jgi:hypothetical protein
MTFRWVGIPIHPIDILPHMSGKQEIYRFLNGYGASVIYEIDFKDLVAGTLKAKRGEIVHLEGDDVLYELGVLVWERGTDNHILTYKTSVADDVLRYLNKKELEKALQAISDLPDAPDGECVEIAGENEDKRNQLMKAIEEKNVEGGSE